jgi:hypothetical protein
MRTRHTYILKTLLLGLLFVVPISTTLLNAQESQDCPLMMRDYSALQEACADMPDGTLCYGAGDVTAFVDCEVTPDFNEMGDQLPLATVCALHAQGESENEMQTQGVALMRIASAVSEIPVQMIVMGDVNMQNNSSNATTFETRIDMEAEVRTGPSSQYSIIDTLNAGDIVYVNACNCTGNWLRITLPDGNVGWIAARRATVLDTGMGLPSITPDTPVYNVMQAFTFASAPADESCEQLPAGILIQAPSDVHVPLSINGVAFRLESTVFVHLEPYAMMMDVLDGAVSIETETQLLDVPEGTRIRIPMTLERLPNGDPELTFYTAGDVVDLPLPLLENPINPIEAIEDDTLRIVGQGMCDVVSDAGEAECPIYFINRDGDAITNMQVDFVSAPIGEWASNDYDDPSRLQGNATIGTLNWQPTCSLAGENFIGPVKYSMTLTDETGHTSEPYEVYFNCIDG